MEKVILIHSGKHRNEKAKLRDQIELLQCQVENLERENEAMVELLKAHGIEWKGVPELNE